MISGFYKLNHLKILNRLCADERRLITRRERVCVIIVLSIIGAKLPDLWPGPPVTSISSTDVEFDE